MVVVTFQVGFTLLAEVCKADVSGKYAATEHQFHFSF